MYFSTPLRFMLWPSCTASTIVTELKIKIKVIKLTKASGKLAWPAKGKELNTLLGSAQSLTLNRMVP